VNFFGRMGTTLSRCSTDMVYDFCGNYLDNKDIAAPYNMVLWK